jgi:hypothetical protein
MTTIDFSKEKKDIHISPKKIEEIAPTLTVKQFITILSLPENQRHLSPILVGLSPTVFFHTLQKIHTNQIAALKLESQSEPLQHQIILLIHLLEKEENHIQQQIAELEATIQHLDPAQMHSKDLVDIVHAINQLRREDLAKLPAIDNALELLWNANRIDLIEKLSLLKERLLREMIFQIGHAHPPTGLFEKLEKVLSKVYLSESTGPLNDEEPAIDGLANFSIWYPRDYWEIGLLPQLKNCLELDNNPQKLMEEVQANLKKLNIGTVGELKKANIYSKHMLKEHILKAKG